MQCSTFQIFRSFYNNGFYFRLKSSKGQTILSGEGFKTKHACLNGIELVKINAGYDALYIRKEANGNYTFELTEGHGGVIGTGENYLTASSRDLVIEAVKKDAGFAEVEAS